MVEWTFHVSKLMKVNFVNSLVYRLNNTSAEE